MLFQIRGKDLNTLISPPATTAPKTGENAGVYAAGMIALLSAAGIVVYTKRQKRAY